MSLSIDKILISTKNKDKVREISQKLGGLNLEIKSLLDFPDIPDVIEDGDTLEANALKKARTGYEKTGLLTIADDTGLEVEALDGQPGVYSSRYAGEDATYADNRRKLLQAMQSVPADNRKAAFRTVVVILGEGFEEIVDGVCEGVITTEERGSGGFGYDPVFLIPESGLTFAEMPLVEKNKISHRGIAVAKAVDFLRRIL